MGLNHGSWDACRFSARVAVLALLAGSVATAHDDDVRKLLDAQPMVPGPIWSLDEHPGARGGLFDASNMTLLSQIPLNNFSGLNTSSGNDCWGYVSPSGREYAIMGVEGGYGFVEITNPTNPVIVDTVTGPVSLWHDVKVVGHYAYGVSEGGSGIQVMDLSDIDNGNVRLVRNWTSGGYSTSHNIITNQDSGSLWVSGTNIGNGGLIHIDISNPELPQLDGGWTEMYVHDAQVVTWETGPMAGREIAFCASGFSGGFTSTGLRIVDVTNPNNPQTLATLFYPNPGYSHQVWLSSDRKILYLNDELDEQDGVVPVTTTRIINVEDLTSPQLMGTFTTGKPSIDHNLYTHNGVVYESNYRSGLRVFDALDPTNPIEIGHFDTYPGSDSAQFNGAWSNYPFFPSGNIIISDIERGLFVVRLDAQLRPMALTAETQPDSVSPAGGDTLSARPITRDGVSVDTVGMMLDTGSGFEPVAMSDNGDGTWSATLPIVPCGSDINYYFTASTTDGYSTTFPNNAPSEVLSAQVISSVNELFVDNAETDTGWTVSGSVSDGAWGRGIPAGDGDRGDPPTDYDGSGSCWLTDNVAGNSDVDGGTTVLTSPALDATAGNTTLSYALWYSNNVGVVDDSMTVQVSNNNGSSWTTVLTLGPGDEAAGGGWYRYEVDLDTVFTSPSSQVRLRFNVGDTGDGSVVEAGVDAIELVQKICEDVATGCNAADLAEPLGTLNFFDVSAFLNAFNMGDSAADLNADGSFNFFDVSGFLTAFNAGCP